MKQSSLRLVLVPVDQPAVVQLAEPVDQLVAVQLDQPVAVQLVEPVDQPVAVQLVAPQVPGQPLAVRRHQLMHLRAPMLMHRRPVVAV